MHDTLKAETLATLSQAQNVGNSRRIINWRRAITQWWPQALLDRSSCFFFLFVASAEISAVATNLKWSRATSWWRHRTLPAIYWWDDCHPNESFSCPHPFISSGMRNVPTISPWQNVSIHNVRRCQCCNMADPERTALAALPACHFLAGSPLHQLRPKVALWRGKPLSKILCLIIIRKVPYPPDNSFTCVFNMFASVKLLCWSIYLLVNLIL